MEHTTEFVTCNKYAKEATIDVSQMRSTLQLKEVVASLSESPVSLEEYSIHLTEVLSFQHLTNDWIELLLETSRLLTRDLETEEHISKKARTMEEKAAERQKSYPRVYYHERKPNRLHYFEFHSPKAEVIHGIYKISEEEEELYIPPDEGVSEFARNILFTKVIEHGSSWIRKPLTIFDTAARMDSLRISIVEEDVSDEKDALEKVAHFINMAKAAGSCLDTLLDSETQEEPLNLGAIPEIF